jgi:tetratricopeptide (TPR) repeat protein
VKGKSATRHGECLTEECLTDYLEGTLDPIVKSACEAHLITCDPCRENLALFMKVLRDETTPEEEMALQQLSEMLEKRNLRPVSVPSRRSVSTKYRTVAAAGIAALLLTAVFIYRMPFGSSPSTSTQIVSALANSIRPFEPRIVGQRYLEVQEVTRAAEGNLVPDILAAQMTESSADSYEMGRFFLLRKEFGKAIRHLKTAVSDPKGVPADVHNDLGVAYLESGEDNFVAAETEFKSALSQNTTHAPALFNLSILYERQGRLAEAVERRQQYLELDPDSGWAKEIQKKLSRKESTEP